MSLDLCVPFLFSTWLRCHSLCTPSVSVAPPGTAPLPDIHLLFHRPAQLSGFTAPVGDGLGRPVDVIFSPPGYPDLITPGSLARSQADRGPQCLTLAPGSPGFTSNLPHSSAGGPWANDCTSSSLSFLIPTRGAQTLQQLRNRRALPPSPLLRHPGGRYKSAGPQEEPQRQPVRPPPGGQ